MCTCDCANKFTQGVVRNQDQKCRLPKPTHNHIFWIRFWEAALYLSAAGGCSAALLCRSHNCRLNACKLAHSVCTVNENNEEGNGKKPGGRTEPQPKTRNMMTTKVVGWNNVRLIQMTVIVVHSIFIVIQFVHDDMRRRRHGCGGFVRETVRSAITPFPRHALCGLIECKQPEEYVCTMRCGTCPLYASHNICTHCGRTRSTQMLKSVAVLCAYQRRVCVR